MCMYKGKKDADLGKLLKKVPSYDSTNQKSVTELSTSTYLLDTIKDTYLSDIIR